MEGVLSGHPEGLMQRILGWLEVRELGRCSRTCRAWSQAGSSDELWEALHVRKQRHVQNAGACGLWQSAGRFTISDRGSTLKQLDIPCPAEPLAAVRMASEIRETGDTGLVSPLLSWKSTVRAATAEARRVRLTDQDLTGNAWAVRFLGTLLPVTHLHGADVLPGGARFSRDRRFVDALVFTEGEAARWSIGGGGSRVLLDALDGSNALVLHVSRLPGGAWRLTDARGSMELLSLDIALGGAVSVPANLPPPQALEHEDWREYDIYSPFDDGYDSDANQAGGPASPRSELGSLDPRNETGDSYSGCFDSPAHYPEEVPDDAGPVALPVAEEQEISARALQGMLNSMLLYDSYGSDDLDDI